MGKVTVSARIENLIDAHAVESGHLAPEAVRAIEVPDALIDTGATGLSMPASLVAPLGLTLRRTRKARTAGGVIDTRILGTVRLIVQGRDCPCDVTELPDGAPVLIGQIPLEAFDFVVDLVGRRLIGNPAHGGEQIIELYGWSSAGSGESC